MARTFLFFLVVLLSTAAIGCSTSVNSGNAALPAGIEEAKVPQTGLGGYVYFSSNPPLSITVEAPCGRDAPVLNEFDHSSHNTFLDVANLEHRWNHGSIS